MRKHLLLAGILLLGAALRIYDLENTPKGLHADEASFVINTQAILETGRDEDNRRLPLFLTSIKDPKPALFSYLQLPFFALLGPSTTASRLPSVMLGIVSIYLAFRLVFALTHNPGLGLGMAAVLSISPWHIMNSRSTEELIMSLVFLQLALIACQPLFQTWLEEPRWQIRALPWKQLLLFGIFSLLAMYSYHSAKIVLLAFFGLVLAWPLMTKWQAVRVAKSGVVLAIVAIAFILTASSAVIRFNSIGLLTYDLPKAEIFEFTTITTGTTPLVLMRVFYNKVIFYGLLFVEQYFDHFNLNFLFTIGGATARHIIPKQGLFHLVEALLMAMGGYAILTTAKYRKWLPYWLILVLVSPIPAALTTEDVPSSLRAFTLLLPLALLVVLGAEKLWQNRKFWLAKLLILLVAGGYLWGVAFFIQQSFVAAAVWQPWHRSRDYEVTAQEVAKIANDYDTVIVTNDLREMYIYFWQQGLISIPEIQAQPLARYQQQYQMGKYVFNRDNCNASASRGKTLVVAALSCGEPSGGQFRLLTETQFDDGKPAFRIFESVPSQDGNQ